MPAYLITEVAKNEVDEKGHPVRTKDKILEQCQARGNQWAEAVRLRVIGAPYDLHASDARYHRDCRNRFFSNRCAPGDSMPTAEDIETPQQADLKQLIGEMQADRTKIWDSVQLQMRFTEIVGSERWCTGCRC